MRSDGQQCTGGRGPARGGASTDTVRTVVVAGDPPVAGARRGTRRGRWVEVDGDEVSVHAPDVLTAPLRVALQDVTVGLVPRGAAISAGALAPLVVPAFDPAPTLVLLVRRPATLPALRRRFELDVDLPVTRAASRAGLASVDGVLLEVRDAAASVATLEAAGMASVDDVPVALRRLQHARRVVASTPPRRDAAELVELALHGAVLVEVAALWPMAHDPVLSWSVVGVTLTAALLARPLLARRAVRVAQRATHRAVARRSDLDRFG